MELLKIKPVCLGGEGLPPSFSYTIPSIIKIEAPNIPQITCDWGATPEISLCVFVSSPGVTFEDHCKVQEKHGCEPPTETKCEAIIEKLVGIINSREKISFDWDIGGWTAKIQQGKMHAKVGKPGGTYQDFVNDLYNLLLKRNSDGM
jgi:hypothetical protein